MTGSIAVVEPQSPPVSNHRPFRRVDVAASQINLLLKARSEAIMDTQRKAHSSGTSAVYFHGIRQTALQSISTENGEHIVHSLCFVFSCCVGGRWRGVRLLDGALFRLRVRIKAKLLLSFESVFLN